MALVGILYHKKGVSSIGKCRKEAVLTQFTIHSQANPARYDSLTEMNRPPTNGAGAPWGIPSPTFPLRSAQKFICDKVFGVPSPFLQALLAVRGPLAAGGTLSYSMFCLRISIRSSKPPEACSPLLQACARSSVFLILPLMVLGISETNSTVRIHLYSASLVLQKSLICFSSSLAGV